MKDILAHAVAILRAADGIPLVNPPSELCGYRRYNSSSVSSFLTRRSEGSSYVGSLEARTKDTQRSPAAVACLNSTPLQRFTSNFLMLSSPPKGSPSYSGWRQDVLEDVRPHGLTICGGRAGPSKAHQGSKDQLSQYANDCVSEVDELIDVAQSMMVYREPEQPTLVLKRLLGMAGMPAICYELDGIKPEDRDRMYAARLIEATCKVQQGEWQGGKYYTRPARVLVGGRTLQDFLDDVEAKENIRQTQQDQKDRKAKERKCSDFGHLSPTLCARLTCTLLARDLPRTIQILSKSPPAERIGVKVRCGSRQIGSKLRGFEDKDVKREIYERVLMQKYWQWMLRKEKINKDSPSP